MRITTHQLVAIENHKGYPPITAQIQDDCGSKMITVRRWPVGVKNLSNHQRSWFSDLMWVCSDRERSLQRLCASRQARGTHCLPDLDLGNNYWMVEERKIRRRREECACGLRTHSMTKLQGSRTRRHYSVDVTGTGRTGPQ